MRGSAIPNRTKDLMTSCRHLTTPDQWAPVIKLIKAARSIAISGHTNPDGDALGSNLGLGLALKHAFPQKDVRCLLADDAPVPRVYRFMAGTESLSPACRYLGTPDLFISVDAPTIERINDSARVAERAFASVAIDHHPSREEFPDVTVRCVKAAACAVLIDELLSYAGIPLTPDVATCLFTGLVTDTGRFQYQNADPVAFACAARLVDDGAEPARVALEVYQSQRIQYLQLESIVMGRIRTVSHGRVAYSFVYASDLEVCGVSNDECDGLVDVVRAVGGTKVCLFLKETVPGREIRGNLRSKCELDISNIASVFHGGGHPAASGFTYCGTVQEALDDILPMLEELVEGRQVLPPSRIGDTTFFPALTDSMVSGRADR